MKKNKLIIFLAFLIGAGLLIFLFFYSRPALGRANVFLINIRTLTYSRLSFFGNLVSEIKKTRSLVEENIKLKEDKQALLSRLANQEQINERSHFLEEALNLSLPREKRISDAGVYNIKFTPQGYYLLINKGSAESQVKGDIVISSSGILIGVVDQVFNDHSRVSAIMNSGSKATIKILSKDISGIANGAMENGLYLDFIAQSDEIGEGDTVTTSGFDIFPPGLIVGKVKSVNIKNGNLFKDVKVEPALNNIDLSRVIVISR